MFLLKKLLSRALFPVPLCAGLLLMGLCLSLAKRTRGGRACLTVATVLLLLFSYPWLPDCGLARLEQRFPPLSQPQQLGVPRPLVCVLGQGVDADSGRPPNSRLNPDLTCRLVEAARLLRALPEAKVVASLGQRVDSTGELSTVLREFYASLGVEAARVSSIDGVKDTAAEIRAFRGIAGTNTVFLVSSASHLPRAMVLAERTGLKSIPCPCNYLVSSDSGPWDSQSLFPNSANLRKSERLVYECLGLLWELTIGSL